MTTTPGRCALDTNIVIALLNEEAGVLERWSSAETAMLPAPLLGELLYGALRSSARQANEARVLDVAQAMELIACDEAVCAQYARVRTAMASLGNPIPENDLWVAACSLAAGATLVTRDAHFATVPELVCVEW